MEGPLPCELVANSDEHICKLKGLKLEDGEQVAESQTEVVEPSEDAEPDSDKCVSSASDAKTTTAPAATRFERPKATQGKMQLYYLCYWDSLCAY